MDQASADDATKQQEATQEQEETKEPKLSFKEKCQARFSSINERYKEKFPKAHEKTSHYASVCVEVWHETFPDTGAKTSGRMSKRRERAKMAREWEEK